MRHSMRHLFLSFFALIAASGSIQAQHKPRWAIIGSKAVQDAGLTDLLTADLAPQFNLVERAQLDLALKELTLSEALGSNSAQRLKLGKLLKADLLVFVADQTTKDTKPHVKLVISETRL